MIDGLKLDLKGLGNTKLGSCGFELWCYFPCLRILHEKLISSPFFRHNLESNNWVIKIIFN